MKQIPNNLFFDWVESEIAEGRAVRFRMKGISMFPLLRSEKDEVVVYPCSKEELRPMDVVLFRYHSKHLLHRIIEREGNRLTIQGDGSYVAKEQCTTDDVVAKVQKIIRTSGTIIYVNSWRWRFLSSMWIGLSFLRRPCLRVLHLLFD